MKQTFCQIAQDCRGASALTGSARRTVLQWFRSPSLYFPAGQETEQAFDAFLWLHQQVCADAALLSTPQAQEDCLARFSRAFSLPAETARPLLCGFLRRYSRPAPIIVGIEGLDGAGKAVQSSRLCAALNQAGKRARVIDFPQYDSFFGREIGALLSGRGGVSAMELDEKSMCLWYALDRWQAIRGLRLEEFDYLIFNRYTLSNVVYQSARKYGGLNREFADWIFALEHIQLNLPIPDLYLYLDTRTDFCQENVLKKERDYVDGLDVYEKSRDLLLDCHAVYRELSGEIDEICALECLDQSGALKPIDEIAADILGQLEEYGLL